VLLFAGAALLFAGSASLRAADVWPNCSFHCTANDVTLTSVYVQASGGPCEPGATGTAQVYGRFTSSARRYAVILMGDLRVAGAATRRITSCAGDLAVGTTDVLLATITWPCGSAVSLDNVIVSWSASPESCSDATCASRVAKCSSGRDIVVSTPLVVDFTSSSPQCLGTPIAFTDATTGGSAPYTYSWAFGDGGTSSQASPTHTYAASGDYAVTLAVRDRNGASDSHSRTVTVSAIPAATAGNAGPYCPGETIQLVASGGTSYAWTGPGGFTSADRNPTIPAAGPAQAGAYTVTVTNSAGCTAQASTIVVVDSTPPLLTTPSDVAVPCGHSTTPAATGQATATDDSGHAPAISFSDSASFVGCGGTGTIVRTWTATDACGNSISAHQKITVADAAAPTLLVPTDVAVECGDSTLPAATGLATATDGCSTPTVSYVDSPSLSSCGGTGTIARTWIATDSCDNVSTGVQTITVVDTQAPHLNVPEDIAVGCGDAVDPAATGWATATDTCGMPAVSYADDADLTGCGGAGTIRRTWTATDACGHTAMGVQTIVVAEPPAPRLTLPDDVTVECGHSVAPAATGQAAATGDCSMPVVTYTDEARLTGYCGTGTIYRTWMAADACGHVTSAVQRIVVVDTQAPSLTVPSDVTVRVGQSTLPATTGQAAAADACSIAALTYSDAEDLAADGTGTITRTWTATDLCGHGSTGVQTIAVVLAPPPPTLTLVPPADVTVAPNYPTDPTTAGYASVHSTCPTPPVVAYADVEALNGCNGTGVIERTWTAYDACGSAASGLQTIWVVDATSPVLVLPADVTIEAESPSDPSATGWATASDPDADDEPPLVAYSDVALLSGCDETGTILRTWTATDVCGNRSTGVQTITVIDSGHIRIEVPADVTVQAGDPTTPDATGWATAIDPDAVDEALSVTYADAADLSGCDGTGTIVRTWTATDACGNSSSAVQMILVVDSVAPVLTVPADITIETVDSRDPSFTGWASVGHHDPEHAPTLTYRDQADLTGCDGTGSILRTWTALDGCGNSVSAEQTITVVDSGHVSLLVPPPAEVACGDPYSPDVTGWATASDPDAIYEAPEVTYSDSLQLSGCGGAGTVTRTWRAADECGNTTSAAQTIRLVDDVPPTLTAPTDVVVEYGDSTSPLATGLAAASDRCSPASIAHADVEVPGDCAGRSTILRTWTATDECGNSASVVQTITIVDMTPPALVLPPDATVECGHSTDPASTGSASASDRSGASVAHSDLILGAGCGGGATILRTWTATDGCGNASSAVQRISAIDSTPPSLTTPPNTTVQVGQDVLPHLTGQALATDSCSQPTVRYTDAASLDQNGLGTIVRTWTAVDGCENAATSDQIIRVVAAPLPPSLSLVVPPNLDVDVGQPTAPAATGLAVARSTCDGGARVTYSDDAALYGCGGAGTIERTWEATDACGNRVTGVQRIRVLFSGDVRLVAPGDVTVSCGDSIDPALTGWAVAYDPVSGGASPTVSYEDFAELDAWTGAGVVLRLWTATGACGSSASAIQTIAVAGSCAPRVIISEVAWAGTGASSDEQWIELRNLSDRLVDLTGWSLRWRVAKPEVPGDEVWRELALAGTIDPAERDAELVFGPNPEDPSTWWVDLSGRQARRDFFLLERGSDDTVTGVEAGLVYDPGVTGDRTLALPRQGAVLELVSPTGYVVDTANADRDDVGGWAAGDALTIGSMERTDAYAPDSDTNWHTNLGVITAGEDADGADLLATAGLENEPRLAQLVARAALAALPAGGGASLVVPLPEGVDASGAGTTRVVALTLETSLPVALPIDASTLGQEVTLRPTGPLPSGRSAVWVRVGDAAVLIVLGDT